MPDTSYYAIAVFCWHAICNTVMLGFSSRQTDVPVNVIQHTHTHTKAVTNLWAVLVSRPDVYRIIPLDFLSLGLFVHSVTTSALTQVRERGGHLLAAGT